MYDSPIMFERISPSFAHIRFNPCYFLLSQKSDGFFLSSYLLSFELSSKDFRWVLANKGSIRFANRVPAEVKNS